MSTDLRQLYWLQICLFQAAQRFVESYYPALQTARSSLDSFYVPSSSLSDGKTVPTIVFNGNVIPDPLALRTLFENEMPHAHYEVQSFDCHVLNPNYSLAGPGIHPPSSGKNMSIILTVSGYVRYGESRDGAMRGFSESIVLIPNPDSSSSRARGIPKRDWLIQSQNFRLVVWRSFPEPQSKPANNTMFTAIARGRASASWG